MYTWVSASSSLSELELEEFELLWTFIKSGSCCAGSSLSGVSRVLNSSSLTTFLFPLPFGADCLPDFLELTVVSGVSSRLVGLGAGSGFSLIDFA